MATMLNQDFTRRVVQYAAESVFVPSPLPGVERRMLERVGGEVARATSIVRYAPGSSFTAHTHGGGEEFLVLQGVFSDETGDHPAGTYIRNPPGTTHAPFSALGCTIFVKLWQFTPDDCAPVRIETRRASWHAGSAPGMETLSLHEHDGILTAMVRWSAHARFPLHTHPGGEEILVVDGSLHDDDGDYPVGTWIRSPRYSRHAPCAGAGGALIYVKTGHIGAPWLPLPPGP